MPADPPTTPRRPRPDRLFRSRALDLPAPAPVAPQPASEQPSTDGPQESLSDSLARLPDIDRPIAEPELDDRRAAIPGSIEAAGHGPPDTPGPDPSAGRVERGLWSDSDPVDCAPTGPAEDPAPTATSSLPSSSHRVALWRRTVFALVVVALIGSIPVLASAGYRLVTRSTDGKFTQGSKGPKDPGYEELVTSTSTSAVIQTDGEGKLVAVTVLSLGSGSAGGSVIFIPVDTLLPVPLLDFDRLSSTDAITGSTVQERAKLVSDNVAQILNVGIDETIMLDADGWKNAVEPVAPFTIDSPDSVDVGGTLVSSGSTDLTAGQVGPYMALARPDEPQQSRLIRQEAVWRGWLGAIAASGAGDAVPGESGSGLGLFARTLAKGDVRYETLPGQVVATFPGGFRPGAAGIKELVSAAVPVPDPATPGSRRSVRLLNGVSPDALPVELIQQVAALDASVTVVGNGPSFDRAQTSIIFADPANRAYATVLGNALGATGAVTNEPDAPENIDVTVVLGRDVLGDGGSSTTKAPISVPPGGN